MIGCRFDLNDRPMSSFLCGSRLFPAFSGLGRHVNRRISACIANAGPIPPGNYYIFDRQSGGLLGPLRDIFNNHSDWFALYAVDGKIDDETYCNQVKRGYFRLHPKGPWGISEGCITLESKSDFQLLRVILKASKQEVVPGSTLLAYGKVWVR
jgi:type VI secretion system (T6SS) effector TldE1-like protein